MVVHRQIMYKINFVALVNMQFYTSSDKIPEQNCYTSAGSVIKIIFLLMLNAFQALCSSFWKPKSEKSSSARSMNSEFEVSRTAQSVIFGL